MNNHRLFRRLLFSLAVLPVQLALVSAQTDSLVDCFPLSVGNQWQYNFYHDKWVDLDPGQYYMTDTGKVTYRTVGKTVYPDSVLWLIRQSRTLHRRSGGWPNTPSADSVIVDTVSLVLVELTSGSHELYLQLPVAENYGADFGANFYNFAFGFWRGMPDSLRVYRFSAVDSASKALYDLPYGPARRRIVLQKGLGVVSTQMGSLVVLDFSNSTFDLLFHVVLDVRTPSPGEAPMHISLEQNYPNPFNPTTTIGFALPQRSEATLSVFNLLGQPVATLVSGQIQEGRHEVTFDASGLASGVYFYRLSAGPYTQTRKMLILR